ncbi:hypothetical protein [Maribacter polysaccharolyticus]|uniref:hypothetical protein n=1 Tax=Maribacter polysaccharolyticus TaxID=3020831 RepID=UPI00237EEE9E|nr:hypothetical protein [Maribacter polysaccharolyticus]MDE3744124.1 hypothetical protein [Maribacter polysaccharolyticus]
MKLTKEYIKNNYLILIIKLLIISFFIISIVVGIQRTTKYYYAFAIYENSRFTEYLNILKIQNYFKSTIVLLIPLIGVFIYKKIGWILITSFNYFVISAIVFMSVYFFKDMSAEDFLNEKYGIFQVLTFIIIITIPLIIINKEKIRNGTYGISKSNMIIMNIGSSLLGMGMTILLTYLNQ